MTLSHHHASSSTHRLAGLLATLVLVLPVAQADAATAGRFQFVAGDVRVLPADGGTPVPVRRGAEVQPGDTVITAVRGIAQLRMVDGAQLAVRPATRLRIDDYRFDQPEQEDRSFFSLLSGAFRSVTGLIGQRNTAAYQVATSTATIGIRGSDADIGHDEASKLTAVRTYDGAHVLTSRDASGRTTSLVTGPGDIAVALPGQAPRFAAEFPFSTAPPARGDEGAEAGEQRDGEQAGGEADGDGEAAPPARRQATAGDSDTGRTLGPRPAPVRTIISAAGANALDVVRVAPTGSVVVGGDLARDAAGILKAQAGGLIVNPPQSIVLLGPANEVVLVADVDSVSETGGSFTFLAASATLVQSGAFAIPAAGGGVAAKGTWGLWQGPFVIIDDGRVQNGLGGFPFAIADPATTVKQMVALGGTGFTYKLSGGAITNEQGARATSYSLTANGAFSGGASLGAISINGSADFAAGSSGWTMAGAGSIRDLLQDNIVLGGTCGGCSAPVGEVGGRFVGSRAEGLLLGVGLADHATGKGVIGSAVLRR